MRVLGIDCGTERTGYGVIESDGRDHRIIACGVIRTSPRESLEQRLLKIGRELREVIERFRPEAKAARPKFAYFPFGGGPRVCIGEGFAWMEGVLLLATLARRWKPRLESGQSVVPAPSITLRPKHGIRMRLERRRA